MKRVLLIVGGIVQLALAAMHVAMFFAPLPESARPAGYVLNGCVTSVVLFFAYLSLFKRRDLAETPAGRVVCCFIACFYGETVIVGIVKSGRLLDDPFKFGLLLPTALLYAFVAAPALPRRALLAAGGTLQVILAAIHVTAFFPSVGGAQIPESLRRSFYGFNAAVTVVVLGFACMTLFRARDLAETPIGRVVCGFIALFHLQRVVVGFITPGFDEHGLGWVLLATALIYGAVAARERPYRAPGVA